MQKTTHPMFKAEVIAASRNTFGNRITTMLVTFPRMILAELNTHRMLSKNSASSRAIPLAKMIKAVEENPFIPIEWQRNHKGMQGTELVNEDDAWHCKNTWLVARDHAVYQAKLLGERYDVTKQLCNRLLEPFMWHTVLVTATEWENFFALRAHKDAEIHMQKLAYLMLDAYNNAHVEQLQPGQWHVPFSYASGTPIADAYLKVATARAAQTSYTIVGEDEKPSSWEKLIQLHDEKLVPSGHWSPFEHCARAINSIEHDTKGHNLIWNQRANTYWLDEKGWCGNFRGFIQYRKTFPGENKSDDRVKH